VFGKLIIGWVNYRVFVWLSSGVTAEDCPILVGVGVHIFSQLKYIIYIYIN